MKNVLPALAALLLASCATAPRVAPEPVAARRAFLGEHGFELGSLDRSVGPCDDFYQYAVGGWRKANPLPGSYARYGRFEEVAERNRATLRAILEGSAPGTQLGDFWAACTNETLIEQQGIAPIADELRRIDAMRSKQDVVDNIHALMQQGLAPLFRFSAQNDLKNSQLVIATVSQGGLGLPDRDYYLRDDERFRSYRAEYVKHIARMFELAGVDRAKAGADAQRVMEVETALAKASMARVDLRDPENTYHVIPLSELQSFAPSLDWTKFFSTIGLAHLRSLNVQQPEFVREAARLVEELPLETWKAHLRWNLLDDAAPMLSTPFVSQDFAFRGTVLTGTKELDPRWRRCVRAADATMGDILGQEYVKRAFTPAAKMEMSALIDNLIAALAEGIPQLTWMGPQTKAAATEKLHAFRRRIGFPDKWIDYSTLKVGRDSYAENFFAARAFSFRRAVNRIGKPDDPNEWGFFTPATVNAGYSPSRNDITFPAGILQPPFYDPAADMAYNYGGIGTAIGHEMTHGFDDQGARYDARGNLRDWWTAADLRNFHARAECIADQYEKFGVEEGLNLQGKLVTGEAIADLGGVTLAYRAYQKHLSQHERRTLDGFTPEQRFFLGFAQVWGQNMSAEEARRRALTDPHAPGPNRVNGTVSNMPEFATAWSCPSGATMVRAEGERCTVW